MNAIAPICLLSALLAQVPAGPRTASQDEILFRCDFESDTWFKEWGVARAPERAELVASDDDLKFKPLDGKALRVRIDKGGHYGLSLAYEFRKRLGYEPEAYLLPSRLRTMESRRRQFAGSVAPMACGWGAAGQRTDGWSARGLFEGQRNGAPDRLSTVSLDMRGSMGRLAVASGRPRPLETTVGTCTSNT